jgi:hypothetical protein
MDQELEYVECMQANAVLMWPKGIFIMHYAYLSDSTNSFKFE